MAKPSTSKDIDPELQKVLSNKESARFLKRVLQKAEEERKRVDMGAHYDRTAAFTGLDKRTIANLELDILSNVEITELNEIKRSQIHDQLIYFYLQEAKVPTTMHLYSSLYGQIPIHIDIRTFRKYLASMGYVWLQVQNRFVVTERPRVTFERYYYLRDIVRYREENREIFYVDETVLTTATGNYYSVKYYHRLKNVAAKAGKDIAQSDLVKSIYAVSKTGVYALKQINMVTKSDDFMPVIFDDWMINELLPLLPPNSVVVIKNEKHHDAAIEKPSLYSIKEEMMEWLNRNNVSYDENMSKCELLSLIDTYTTENDGVKKIENIFKCNGHTVLRLPFSVEHISLSHHIFELIKLNAPRNIDKSSLAKICDAITPTQFKAYDMNVAELEKQTLQIDMRVDEVLDNLIASMRSGVFDYQVDSEVPLSDSD